MKKKLLIASLVIACLLSVLFLASCDGGNVEDDRPTYTVTFDPKGGSFDGELTIEVKEGDKIPKPADPVFEGKTFNGWFAGKSSSSRWKFDTDTVTSDLTLTAWYYGAVGCPHTDTTVNTAKSYPATCTTAGRTYYNCNACGFELPYVNEPKLGHDLAVEKVEVTCAVDGYTKTYCKRDGCDYSDIDNRKPATGVHEWGDSFITIVEPTKYTEGKEAKECVVCGAKKTFVIPSNAVLDDLLYDIEIGNYKYTGGEYTNAPFVNIAGFAGISASSYYTICNAHNAVDGATGSFWCADTLVEGGSYKGNFINLEFDEAFDIGMIKMIVPHYYAWELGEDCYVSYDLQAKINGEWETVAVLSDKNAVPSGISGAIAYEFDTPINTDSLRFVVSNSSRYTPAMVYEIEIMAATKETNRVVTDLINAGSIASSGKHNSWATGAEAITDGVFTTAWQTNIRDKNQGKINEVYASISFAEERFVAALQFVVYADHAKSFSLHYTDENGEWVKIGDYDVKKSKDKYVGSECSLNVEQDGKKYIVFTVDLEKFTKDVKLVVEKDSSGESFVCEFTPYTVSEQAYNVLQYSGCSHNSFKELTPVLPTCTEAGYTPMECRSCGFVTSSNATDCLGHVWGEYKVSLAASENEAGTKVSSCEACDAEKSTLYYNDYDEIRITTYKNNAPAAWAQTFDDGNYVETYDWLVPKLQHYGWRATAVLSVCYVDMLVPTWQEHFATGVLDLGSHSYTHGPYYGGDISESSLLDDVHNAHYWFMNKFAGQRILGFATPNGATSTDTSEYVTSIMASARNGGNSAHFYNLIEDFAAVGDKIPVWTTDEEGNKVQLTDSKGNLVWNTERRVWGNMNSYISKADQTEGAFVFVSSNNKTPVTYKEVTEKPVIDPETGEQAVDENGELVFEKLSKPEYEVVSSGGYKIENGKYKWNDKGGDYSLVKTPSGAYHYVAVADYSKNYVYDSETNRLQPKEKCEGTYKFVSVTETSYDSKGNEIVKILDTYYEWVEIGSYDYQNGEFIFREDNSGEYKLNHTTLGTYENGINEILEVGGMTVECLHAILPDFSTPNYIYSSYTSTNSKFTYLDQTGIWVCSYTELIQYIREQVYSTIETISRSENEVVFNITDTLDDIMFNYALTVEVDVDDSWTADKITATQNGEAVEFFVENGYVYVNAVPDRGNVVISYNA